jgi:hypothetical protein
VENAVLPVHAPGVMYRNANGINVGKQCTLVHAEKVASVVNCDYNENNLSGKELIVLQNLQMFVVSILLNGEAMLSAVAA